MSFSSIRHISVAVAYHFAAIEMRWTSYQHHSGTHIGWVDNVCKAKKNNRKGDRTAMRLCTCISFNWVPELVSSTGMIVPGKHKCSAPHGQSTSYLSNGWLFSDIFDRSIGGDVSGNCNTPLCVRSSQTASWNGRAPNHWPTTANAVLQVHSNTIDNQHTPDRRGKQTLSGRTLPLIRVLRQVIIANCWRMPMFCWIIGILKA